MRGYERLQLELIASEYRRRGYIVDTEQVLSSGGLRFDCIARSERGEMVFVELLNANMSEEQMSVRRRVISEAASLYPEAVIDFRYVDTKDTSFSRFNHSENRDHFYKFKKLLGLRLPPLDEKPESASKQMLALWYGYASLLRAYARLWSHPEVESASILDLYNSFLKKGILSPAEIKDDQVEDDLFQMHDAMIAVTQGALVSLDYVTQLRRHYQWLRKQVRSLKNPRFVEDGVRW
jgi:hypothetical protein